MVEFVKDSPYELLHDFLINIGVKNLYRTATNSYSRAPSYLHFCEILTKNYREE